MTTPVINKRQPSQFWDRWYHANELNRLDMVLQLTGMKDHAIAVLTNSYLVDLADYLEKVLRTQNGGD